MKIVWAFILIAISGMIGFIAFQGSAIREQRQQIQKLSEKSESAPSLELQEKCAKQALAEFKLEGGEKKELASFLNHYDGTLKKCFVETQEEGVSKILRTKSGDMAPFSNRLVTDPFEGRIYATFRWTNREDKKYWDVPPSTCKVTFPTTQEDHTCKSEDEFKALVAEAFGIREE